MSSNQPEFDLMDYIGKVQTAISRDRQILNSDSEEEIFQLLIGAAGANEEQMALCLAKVYVCGILYFVLNSQPIDEYKLSAFCEKVSKATKVRFDEAARLVDIWLKILDVDILRDLDPSIESKYSVFDIQKDFEERTAQAKHNLFYKGRFLLTEGPGIWQTPADCAVSADVQYADSQGQIKMARRLACFSPRMFTVSTGAYLKDFFKIVSLTIGSHVSANIARYSSLLVIIGYTAYTLYSGCLESKNFDVFSNISALIIRICFILFFAFLTLYLTNKVSPALFIDTSDIMDIDKVLSITVFQHPKNEYRVYGTHWWCNVSGVKFSGNMFTKCCRERELFAPEKNFARGKGTEQDPYLVATPEQLIAVKKECTGGLFKKKVYFKQACDIDFCHYQGMEFCRNLNGGISLFKLPLKINKLGVFESILLFFWGVFGNQSRDSKRLKWECFCPSKEFNGFYDGNNCMIRGLIDVTPHHKNTVGIFGIIGEKGVVRDLTIFEDCLFCAPEKVSSLYIENKGGTIENCHDFAAVVNKID